MRNSCKTSVRKFNGGGEDGTKTVLKDIVFEVVGCVCLDRIGASSGLL
jgi:hypothetical protein